MKSLVLQSWLGRLARAIAAQPLRGKARAGRPSHIGLAVAMLIFLAAAAPNESTPRPTPPTVTTPATQSIRFESIDVRIDPRGTPLAAYQVEITADTPDAKLVGIEGGDAAAYREPPYYDPAALNQNRVILAALNTSADVPSKAFRAARLHVQLAGSARPNWKVKLTTAAGADGGVIAADASLATPATAGEGVAP